MLTSALVAKILNPFKLSDIVRDQRQSVTLCMRRDMQIINTSDHLVLIKIGADVSAVSS